MNTLYRIADALNCDVHVSVVRRAQPKSTTKNKKTTTTKPKVCGGRRAVETCVEQPGLDKKIAERAVKPGFVVDDHFSGPAITRRL